MPETTATEPRVILSGAQPTGKLHIGNYIGAISQWAELQNLGHNYFFIADLHAFTTPEAITPDYLRQKTREFAATYLACGVDPARSTIFVQSHVSQHVELGWLFTCLAPLSWLERMTQFKAKAGGRESVGTGLLCYPALQAADILLYKATHVPVGEDQLQHLELSRDLAARFNGWYGETFPPPEALIRPDGAKIMGLDDALVKMSKSSGEQTRYHAIGILDSPEEIAKAIARAQTDSQPSLDPTQVAPGIANLIMIEAALRNKPYTDVLTELAGQRYGAIKKRVTEVVVATLQPIQEAIHSYLEDPEELDLILSSGAEEARVVAARTMAEVQERVGMVPPKALVTGH